MFRKIILILLIICYHLSANDSIKPYSIGIFGGINYNIHQTNIPVYRNNPVCGIYESGENSSFNFGLKGEYIFYKNLLSIELKFNYQNLPAYFELTTADFKVYNPTMKIYEPLIIKNEFNADLTYLLFEPSIVIKPIDDLPLKFKLGISVGSPIFENNYNTTEEIISPKFYTFEDQTQKHLLQSGKLNNITTSISAISGIVYQKFLYQNVSLQAELNFSYPIESNLNNYDWKVIKTGINLSLNYHFDFEQKKIEKFEYKEIKKEEEKIIVKEEPIRKEINISAKPIEVVKTVVTQTYPLLPYIFFDSASYDLNQKYLRNNPENFDESKLNKETLEIYYSLLDIIGYRLNNNQKLNIEILGTTDGRELSKLEDRLELANKRAKSVANYLINKWGINQNRIKIVAADRPSMPTKDEYPEGSQENRRVEIITKDQEILKPVVHSKFNEYEIKSLNLDVDISAVNIPDNSQFLINIIDGNGNIIYNKVESLTNDKVIIPLNKNNKANISKSLTNNETLYLEFKSTSDQNLYSRDKLQFNIETKNYELGRLNLIVFDFDQYEINLNNRNIINNFVVSSIQNNSKIKIIGSTDKLGEKKYNQKLSNDRANEVYKYLKTIKPNSNYVEVKGIGDSNLFFDNNLPEGRFYCRTVLIEVLTPLEK